MKTRCFIVLILLVGLMSICNAQNVITETITVNQATLTAIRSSLVWGSNNYDPILSGLQQRSNDDIEIEGEISPLTPPTGYVRITQAANNLNSVLFEYPTNQQFFNTAIITPINNISSVEEIMNYFTGFGYQIGEIEEAARRGLNLANITINASYVYDCLYYKQDTDTLIISAVGTLRQVMLVCLGLLEDAEDFYDGIYAGNTSGYLQFQHGFWAKDFRTTAQGDLFGEPPYPGLNLHQYRLDMYGAAGLAALLIAETSEDDPMLQAEMLNMVDYIDTKLEEFVMPQVFPEESRKIGMLAFHTSNSGGYNESIRYAGYVLKYLTPYFVARQRLSSGSKNYFNNPYVAFWINDMAKKVVPAGGSMGKNWNYNDGGYSTSFTPGVLLFFYHAGNDLLTEKNNAAWLVNCSRNSNGDYYYAEFERIDLLIASPFIMRYSSEPSCSPKISEVSILPDFIQNGAWSNSEFSILRPPTNSKTEFLTSASLNVAHENSWGSAHTHADQSSYTYYHAGERFLLDSSSGSFTDHHTWRVSPYAHNMVIIDPQPDVGYQVDPLYRPVSGSSP